MLRFLVRVLFTTICVAAFLGTTEVTFAASTAAKATPTPVTKKTAKKKTSAKSHKSGTKQESSPADTAVIEPIVEAKPTSTSNQVATAKSAPIFSGASNVAPVPFEADEPDQPLVLPHSHSDVTDKPEGDPFEGQANESILNHVAKAIGMEAAKEGWQISPRVRTFPVEFQSPGAGSRAAEFALRSGGNQRAVILTSTYQGVKDASEVYHKETFEATLDKAQSELQLFASNFMVRLRTAPLKPREMPVDKVECETIMGDQFCIHARLIDSIGWDAETITAALQGTYDSSETINLIRDQNLAWPVDKTFVLRGYKECRCRENHLGLDLRAPVGTSIRSVAEGVVRNVGRFSGWGRTVVIQHTMLNGEKFVSLYAHLSKVRNNLKVGDKISRGEIIAQTGMTGRTTAPHLHLEIRPEHEGREVLQKRPARSDRPIDPLKVLNMMKAFIGEALHLSKPAKN